MENSEDPTMKGSVESPVKSPHNSGSPATAPPLSADVDGQGQGQSHVNSSILRRWKREDLLKRGSLILRAVALIFSLLSFIIMATNKHGPDGDWKNFDKYEEYRYLLGISILSTLYSGCQVVRQMYQLKTGISLFEQPTVGLLDFFGDQIVAYLLISGASTAVPMTNRMREGADNIFTDSLAASISMAFFAFFTLALSAMISGFKLSTNQTYI